MTVESKGKAPAAGVHRPLAGAAKLAHDAKKNGKPLPGKPFGATGRAAPADAAGAGAKKTPASSSAKAPTWRERVARIL